MTALRPTIVRQAGISQTTFIFAMVFVAWLIYVTLRGDLAKWLGVFGFGQAPSSGAGAPSASAPSATGGLGGLGSLGSLGSLGDLVGGPGTGAAAPGGTSSGSTSLFDLSNIHLGT